MDWDWGRRAGQDMVIGIGMIQYSRSSNSAYSPSLTPSVGTPLSPAVTAACLSVNTMDKCPFEAHRLLRGLLMEVDVSLKPSSPEKWSVECMTMWLTDGDYDDDGLRCRGYTTIS